MNKTTEALKLAEEAAEFARNICLGMNWSTDLPDEALVAIREALADHSGDANELVMDWSKVKPEAIKSDPMYRMGYAAAMSKFAAQFQAEPVKQEPVAWWNGKETVWFEHELCGWQAPDGCTIPLYAAPVERQWVDLTDDEMWDVFISKDWTGEPLQLMSAVIAAFKEKNK